MRSCKRQQTKSQTEIGDDPLAKRERERENYCARVHSFIRRLAANAYNNNRDVREIEISIIWNVEGGKEKA